MRVKPQIDFHQLPSPTSSVGKQGLAVLAQGVSYGYEIIQAANPRTDVA
ncbi:MAG: hypothetical protein ACI9R3_005221 [Verrucomicrobiales bacterium]|jgi:hypothetical protein